MCFCGFFRWTEKKSALVLGWPLEWVLMIVLLEELAKIALTSQRIHSKKWINNLIDEPEHIPI
jgi:hypothetical protein